MTLYFETPVHFPESGSISINGIWHPNFPLLAISSFSQDRGGFVTIFDEQGEPLNDVNWPIHRSFQITALSWHPEHKILATGWENGEFRLWNSNTDNANFNMIVSPHKSPITLLEFSEKGERLVTCDSIGSVVGWKVDIKGQTILEFHLELKAAITHLTFRKTTIQKQYYQQQQQKQQNVENLAKAAINGDEQALDMFSNWRPKTTARKTHYLSNNNAASSIANSSFYIATQTGTIHHVNNNGTCIEVLNTEDIPLNYVLHHPNRDSLIVMMEGLTIGHFSIDHQGHLSELTRVKLNGRLQARTNNTQGLIWCGNSSLAILTGDLILRIWDIDTNDNYILPINLKLYADNNNPTSNNSNNINNDQNRQINEIFTCLSYNKMNQTLCAGTNIGRIYFWVKNFNKITNNSNSENCWELNFINTVSGTIKQLQWGSIQLRLPLLYVNCVTTIYIMKEQNICANFTEKIWAIQRTTNQIFIENEQFNYLLNIEQQINDMVINEHFAIFTNGRTIFVYTILWNNNNNDDNNNKKEFSLKFTTNFQCDNEKILLHNKTIVLLTIQAVIIKNINGSTLNTINFNANEGEPIGIDLINNYLTIFTIEGCIKIYELSDNNNDNNIKLLQPIKYLPDLLLDFGEIIQAKINSNGTKIALTTAAANLIPDGKLYILDCENDNILYYDFQTISDNGDGGGKFDGICTNRLPLNLYWDQMDPRLLICNAKRIPKLIKSKINNCDYDHIVVTMFVSHDHGIKIHDIKTINKDARLFNLSTPYIILIEKLSIIRELMNDFIGIKNCDQSIKNAIIDFCYNLTINNMDDAFKSIKLIKCNNIWENLAKMCIKTKRLDVANVCLGHIGNARAAMELRLILNNHNYEYEAKLAVLAVHLGMLEEAEELYKQCGRYDLLNKLLRSRNKWHEASNLADKHDRIHLKNTEYRWAQYLERNCDYKEACLHYERANTHKFDIPRMLIEQPQQLEAYMTKTKDPDLLKWWGQYIESQGDMPAALKIYNLAGDIYSQVRVYCFLGDEHKATELTKTNNDKAAFYHMARYYETNGQYENAINFFIRANAYSNAIRLCKEYHMIDELWNIGMVGGNREKLECAHYFDQIDKYERAILLYYRCGMLHKALDLAFKTQQYDILQQIATDLDSNSDPALIEKCANYFVTNEQFDKAVDLLAVAKKYKEAITICLDHNVQLTEDLVEKLTPEKDEIDDNFRIEVLEILAESLMLQGNYHLATKKFTQSGDKIRAMKSLLKSGDTEKIIFFATVSRQREIYIMAANYLQSLDWQNDPNILKNIIIFYSKGRALDLLGNFYVACAQIEIDEFKNYDKAYGALTEAIKCLKKLTTNPIVNQQHLIDIVQQRLNLTKKFLDIRRLFERGDYQAGLTQCQQLLLINDKELENAVRRGDIYALIIQESIKCDQYNEARQAFNDLKQLLINNHSTTPITYYLNKEIIENLAKGLGVSVTTLIPPVKNTSLDEGTTTAATGNEYVEEEITM